MAQVDGALHLFCLISPQYQNVLIELQHNLSELVLSPGNINYRQYRAFKNYVRQAEEPMRFVDGEFLERFLEASPDVQEQVVKGLDMEVEEVREIVEGLRRLH
jgi:DNA damage-binding protein 1